MQNQTIQLLTTATADGASSPFYYEFPYHSFFLIISGNLDGGNINLQMEDPNGNWVNLEDKVYSSPVVAEIEFNVPFKGRVELTGSTAPSLDVWVEGPVRENKIPDNYPFDHYN